MAPRGTVESSVLTQRSHITHRNGHSLFVRKTTAVGARSPRASRSSSQMDAYARDGSRGSFDARCWTTKHHRAATETSLPDLRSRASASFNRSCQIRLNVRRHHALLTRVRGEATAPSWKRRFGLAGMSIPVTALMPAQTTSRLSVCRRSACPSSTCSNGIATAAAMTDRTVKGEKASKPSAAAGANVRT